MRRILPISILGLLCIFLPKVSTAQVTFTDQGNWLGQIVSFGLTDCAVDMNGDYLDDVVRVTWNTIYIDYQDPNGGMIHTSIPMNVQNRPDWSICAGDLDENGFNDLLFGNGSAVSFVLANPTGTNYTEVTHPEYIFSQRSTMADIDNDGDLDAFVCHDVDQSHPYRNDGTGTMTLDTSLIQTLDLPGNYAAIWVDYDNDGDADLYITKCRQGSSAGDPERTNLLYRNNSDGTFTEAAAAANLDDNSQSWATIFEDLDNDGDFDAFIVNHDFENRLLCNDGSGVFIDTIAGSGINATDLGAWENSAADFDNDGFVDIFSEMQSEMHFNNGDFTFTPANLNFRNGGIGDFNNDGFLDVIDGSDLHINDGNSNNWMKVTLEGVQSNWNGIGARIEIFGAWGIQIREIRSTQSFSTMSTLNGHFGLGTATAVDSMVIHWPSGIVNHIVAPAPNVTHHVIEGLGVAIADPIAENGFQVFPNPTTDRVQFSIDGLETADMKAMVMNTTGQIVLEKDYLNGDSKTIELKSLANGVYTVHIAAEGKVFSKKVLVEK